MLSELDVRRIRLSKNQALFREVNERVEHLSDGPVFHGRLSFVCECSHVDCAQQIELSHEEYEHVRGASDQFIVKAGHEIADVENVVETRRDYVIVVKIGAGKDIALVSDSRRG